MRRTLPAIASIAIISNPLFRTSAVIAQSTAAFNPNVPPPGGQRLEGQIGLSRTAGFSDIGSAPEAGGFTITDPRILEALGYDPSRQWQAGDRYSDILRVGDVQNLINADNLTLRQIAERAGVDIDRTPISGVFGRQTLGDIIRLNPELRNAPVDSIPAVRDLVQGNWSGAVSSGLNLARQYSPELNRIFESHPGLRTLPLESVLRGDYRGVLDAAQQEGLRRLSEQLPPELMDLPAGTLSTVESLIRGDIESVASQGVNIALDRSDILNDLVGRYPELQGIPIQQIIQGDWSGVLERGEQLALSQLDQLLPADVKGLTGQYAPLLNDVVNGRFDRAAIEGLTHVPAFQELLAMNPHFAHIPFNELLTGDIQALVSRSQQIAIYELSQRLPENLQGLPAGSITAITALSNGDWQGAVSQGIDLAASEVAVVNQLFEDHPELAGLQVNEILNGDYSSVLDAAERRALDELSRINPVLGELPIRNLLNGNIEASLQQGLQIAGDQLLGDVLASNPALESLSFGILNNPEYTIGSVTGLADTTLSAIDGIEGTPLSDVPGLDQVPLEFISANTITALFNGDLFGTLDVPLGETEMKAENALTGFTRGKKLTPTDCDATQNADIKSCANAELTENNGDSLRGKRLIKGPDQKGPGGWGILKDLLGDENTGIAPWGTNEETYNLKMFVKSVHERGDTLTSTTGGVPIAAGPGYITIGASIGICIDALFIKTCSASAIELPLDFLPEELVDTKIATGGKVLVATSSPAPRLGNFARRFSGGYSGYDNQCLIGSRTNNEVQPGDAAIASVGESNWGSARDRANLLLTSILEAAGTQNQADVAVSIINRTVSNRFPDNATDVVFAPGQYQPNFGLAPVENKGQAIERIARYLFNGDTSAATAEYNGLEQHLSNPRNIIEAQNHIGGATDFRGFTPDTLYLPGDPYRGDPSRPNGQANFFIQESRSAQVATATLGRLGVGSDNFTGISDGNVACSQVAIVPANFTEGDGVATGSYSHPAPGPVTSRWGWRTHPVTLERSFHKGIDIGLAEGTPVMAIEGGTVVYRYNGCVAWNDGCGGPATDGFGPRGGFGNRIEILHPDGTVSAYNHLKNAVPPVGSKISKGQVIGTVGSTGISTGPHLDFQIWKDGGYQNPELFLRF